MANALDAVIQIRRERLVREQAQEQNISNGLSNFATSIFKARQQNDKGSSLNTLADLASKSQNANLQRLVNQQINQQLGVSGGPNPSSFVGQGTGQTNLPAAGSSTNPQNFVGSSGSGIAPDTLDAFGKQTNQSKAQQEVEKDLLKTKSKNSQEAINSIASTMRISDRNVVTIAGSINDLARTFADGIEEGSLGSLTNALKAKGSRIVGGKFGDKFPAASSFPGKKVEVVARMMPLLTQQGEKEGSVRLVESVFRKLSESLPDDQTGPVAGANQMMDSIRNSVRFAMAISEGDFNLPSNADALEEKDLDALSNSTIQRIESISSKVKLTKDQENAIDKLIIESIKPLAKVLKFETEEEVKRSRLPKGTNITFQGRLAEIT